MAAFRFALQASERRIPGCVARPGAQGRGPGLLDPLRARPPRRPVGAHGRRARWRPRPRRRCGSARSSSTTTSATRSSLAKEAATLDVVTERPLRVRPRRRLDDDRLRAVGHPDGPAVGARRRAWPRASRSCAPCGATAAPPSAASTTRSPARPGTPVPVTPGGPPLVIGGGSRRILTLAGRVRRHREHRAEPRRRLHRPRGGGRVGRREVRRPGALGPRGGGGARRRPRAAVLDGGGAGRPERGRGRRVAGAALRPDARPAAGRAAGADRHASSEIAETLRKRREELGFSYIVVHEAEMDALAPVIAELAGT